jgi:hypothetical protein
VAGGIVLCGTVLALFVTMLCVYCTHDAPDSQGYLTPLCFLCCLQSRNFCCPLCGKVAELLSDPAADAKPSATEEQQQQEEQQAQKMAEQVAQMRLTATPAPSSPHVPGSNAGLMSDFLGANLGANMDSELLAGELGGAVGAAAGSGGGMSPGAEDNAPREFGAPLEAAVHAASVAIDPDGDGIPNVDLSTDLRDVVDPAAVSAGHGLSQLPSEMELHADDLDVPPADAQDNYDGLGHVERKNVPQCVPCASQKASPTKTGTGVSEKSSAPVSGVKASLSDEPEYFGGSAGGSAWEGSGLGLRNRISGNAATTSSAMPVSGGMRQDLYAASFGKGGDSGPVRDHAAADNTLHPGEASARDQAQARGQLQGAVAHVQQRLDALNQQIAQVDAIRATNAQAQQAAEAAVVPPPPPRDVVDEWLGIVLVALASSMVLMLWRIVARYYTLFL